MSAKPLVDEMMSSPGAAPAIALVDEDKPIDSPEASLPIAGAGGGRILSLYAPRAAFDLIDELEFLTRRVIDQNVFFAPQFLVPAMPRLDERHVRLMVVRDEMTRRSRLRLLMPFSVERAGIIGGPSTIRVWSHPFGPLGTPLVDADDPVETLRSVLKGLASPALGLPDILVLPDLRLGEPFATAIIAAAKAEGLAVRSANPGDRAALVTGGDPATFLARTLSPKRRRELQRQRRLLEAKGALAFEVAREPVAVRHALEEFLALEASGWKGRERSALVMDRYRAAFAREAVNKLAEKDRVRLFTLRLDGAPVASLVAFVVGREAFAWKMAYDESHGAASPGLQMMAMASERLLADPDVARVDSCAVPDHFLMNRLWKDRIAVSTLVIALRPGLEGRTEAAARGLEQMKASRNFARLMRARLKSMIRFG